MMKAACLISGGMDSSTLAYYAKNEGYDILALHANYGQRTEAKERACAKKIAALLDARDFTEIDLQYFSEISTFGCCHGFHLPFLVLDFAGTTLLPSTLG